MTGSLYARIAQGEAQSGAPPDLDLGHEARLESLAVVAAEGRWVHAAHAIGEGGLALALAEMLLAVSPAAPLGAELDLGPLEAPVVPALFSERAGIVFEVRRSARRASIRPRASASCSRGRSAR
jgi:phosphoribosylformylglycinamidine synthase